MRSLEKKTEALARRYANRIKKEASHLADIEAQSGTAGTASATADWSPVVENWPCVIKPVKEVPGARPNTLQEYAASTYNYQILGAGVSVNKSKLTPLVVTNEMRVKVKATRTEPEVIYTIVDVANLSGVELVIQATLNS